MRVQLLWMTLFFATPFSGFILGQSPDAAYKCPPERNSVHITGTRREATQIRVRDVHFDGATRLPVNVQSEIASNLPTELDDYKGEWLSELEERVAVGWQHYGFFKMQAHGEARVLNSTVNSKDVAVTFHIEEGQRYRLGEIHFLHGTKFSDGELRALFPISAGGLFDTEKIGKGLEAMRRAYGEIGYIDFTAVPETTVDPPNLSISVDIDLDEGNQFRISGIEILRRDLEWMRTSLLNYKIEPGAVFIPSHLDEFLKDQHLTIGFDVERRIDDQNGTICFIIGGPPVSPTQ